MKKGANYIMEQLKNGGEVAIIEGKAGNASGEYRKNGATNAFTANSAFKLLLLSRLTGTDRRLLILPLQ